MSHTIDICTNIITLKIKQQTPDPKNHRINIPPEDLRDYDLSIVLS